MKLFQMRGSQLFEYDTVTGETSLALVGGQGCCPPPPSDFAIAFSADMSTIEAPDIFELHLKQLARQLGVIKLRCGNCHALVSIDARLIEPEICSRTFLGCLKSCKKCKLVIPYA